MKSTKLEMLKVPMSKINTVDTMYTCIQILSSELHSYATEYYYCIELIGGSHLLITDTYLAGSSGM